MEAIDLIIEHPISYRGDGTGTIRADKSSMGQAAGQSPFPVWGGVPRSSADRDMERVDVLDMKGVDPTGVVDSSSAFLTAIALGSASLKPVWIPRGRYKINASLLVDISKTALCSDGAYLDFTNLPSGTALHFFSTAIYPGLQQQVFPCSGGFTLEGAYGTSADGLLIGNDSDDGSIGVSQIRLQNISVYRFRRNISYANSSWRVALEGVYSLEANQFSLYNPPGLAKSGESMGFYHCMFSNGGTIDISDAQWDFYSCSILNCPIVLRGEAHVILNGGNLEAPGNSGLGYYYIDAQDNSYAALLGTNVATQFGALTTHAMFRAASITGGGLVFDCAKVSTDGTYQPELTTGLRTLVEGPGIVAARGIHWYSGPVGTFDYFPFSTSLNAIVNGDAESGDTSGWSTVGTGAGGSFTADALAAKNGTYGFKLAVNSASTFGAFQEFPVSPGQMVSLSAWSKAVAWTYEIRIDFYNSSGALIAGAGSDYQSSSTSWRSTAGIAARRAPAGAVKARLTLFGTGDVVAYFDSVIVNVV